MRKGIGGALGLVAVLGLSLLTGPATAVVPAEPVGSVEPRKRDFLPPCETAESMNCIESIEYQVDGQWRTGTLLPPDGPDTPQTYSYSTPGLQHEGGRSAVSAGLIERDDINGPPYAAYQFQLQASPHGTGTFWDPPVLRCEDGDPSKPGTDPCWRAPWLAEVDYRFTFRTSTLMPIFVQSSVVGTTTSIDPVPGGLRVAVAGRPGPSQWGGDDAPGQGKDQFWAVTYEWAGFVTDARARNGVLAECDGLGIATAYSNGNGGQIPEWDSRTGTLSFGTSGFHYAPDGSVYRGRAEVFVPGELARCMWKVDPRQTARMEVEVYTENGEEAAGTKSIAYDAKADLVKMIAIDFTYSQKQIAARPTPIAAVPGKKACDAANLVCVTVDRARKTAKVSVAKVTGASEVLAVALRGTREDGPQVGASVKKGKVALTVKLLGAKSKGQIWVVRTPWTFISSFQVG
jgi:hypothetical protein